MSARTPRRLRKIAVSGLVATVTAATCLVYSAPVASAAAPTIVNNGTSSALGLVPNWLETHDVASADRSGGVGAQSTAVMGTLVVQHDPGLTVTGLAIDSDWGATDETLTLTPSATGAAITQVPGGTSNYSTVRFSYVPPAIPNLRGTATLGICTLSGDSRPSGLQRVRAVLSDGSRSDVVSATVQVVQSDDCAALFGIGQGSAEFPTVYSAQQNATTITAGSPVQFTFKAQDPDTTGTNDLVDKYRWRVRRISDGTIVQGPTCVDVAGSGADNALQTLNVTFAAAAGRGRYVVETELGGEDEPCTGNLSGNAPASPRFFRLGAVDVTAAPTLTLSAAPGQVQAGTNYTLTATTADAGSDITGRIQAIDWDADGAPGVERRILATEPTGIVAADKSQLVTTAVNQCADRTVTVRSVDNGAMNGSDPSSVQKTASAFTVVNCAPIANDQGVTTAEDTPASFTIAPTDGDSDTLTYSVATAPAHGNITGTYPNFVYAPASNFNGTDSYVYKVDDGHGANDTATVTFTVTAVNDAPVADDIATATNEDTPIVINVDPSISDPDEGDATPQTLTLTLVNQPGTGVAAVTGPAQITYTPNPPANFNGNVSFVYKVDDGQGLANSTDTGVITISVDPVDDAPVADDQSVSTPEDTSKTVNLGPTTDVDAESITYSVPPALQPAHGSVSVTGTSATYTPDLDFNNTYIPGPDTFQYEATDGNSVSTGTITVDVTPVNDAPVADDQSLSTDEDTLLPITLTASDVDNAQSELGFTVIAGPNHGTLDTTTGPGISYTPDHDYNGPDSLTFRVTDGALTDTGTISITVVPVNDPPIADDQSVATPEDDPIAVLLTASDVDNTQAQLTYTIIDAPDNGLLSGSGADLVYTPNLNYNGPDAFSFQVDDGSGGTDEGLVTIDVQATNDAPEMIPQVIATPEDTALSIPLGATDVDDDVATLAFQVINGPSHGTLDTTSGPTVVYSPDLDFNGFDAFVVRVTDPHGASDLGTVVIAVGDPGTNDPPIGDDQTVTTDEDTEVGIALSGSDVDGDDLTYGIELAPDHGTAVISDGSVIYTPNLNYFGDDQIVFRVDDGHGAFNFGTVTIHVTSVNDAPDALAQTVELLEDTATPITLAGTDVEGDALTFAVVSPPSHGHLTGSGANVVYIPNTDYYGSDFFDFSATDSHGASTTATVSLIVDAAPKTVTSMFAEGAVLTIGHLGSLVIVSIPMTAHLTDRATGAGIAGKTVTFTTGNGMFLCTGVTNSAGAAECNGSLALPTVTAILNLGYNANFIGDEDNTAASDNGPLIRLFGLNIL